jgi:hypothetical protein
VPARTIGPAIIGKRGVHSKTIKDSTGINVHVEGGRQLPLSAPAPLLSDRQPLL